MKVGRRTTTCGMKGEPWVQIYDVLSDRSSLGGGFNVSQSGERQQNIERDKMRF